MNMKFRIGIVAAAAAICILSADLRLAVCVLAAALIIILASDIIDKRKTKKQIEELIAYITKVQDYSSLPEMQKKKAE